MVVVVIAIHFFKVDLNNEGHLYRIGVECEDKDAVETHFKQYSRDVRYDGCKEHAGKNDTGNRVIFPGAIIKSCHWIEDKCSTWVGDPE